MLAMYRACALKFKYRYVDKLVPLQAESRHDADFGNAWHAGLAALYAKDGSVKKAQEAFAADYAEKSYPAVLPIRSQGKTFSNGLAALKGYAYKWREEDAHMTVLEVEQRTDSEADKTILKLDLIMQDDRDGQIYPWDHKTTSSYLDNDFWKRYEPNSQVRFYADYAKTRFGDCGGFVINAATFKHRSRAYTPRQGPQKGIQLPAGDWFDFARLVLNPNADCIQLERDNFTYWTARIEADKSSGQWGYNTDSCHQYGRECEYFKLCSAGYSWPRDEELILGYYRQACPKILPEGRCQLDLNHEGDHDSSIAVAPDYTVETEGEVEYAVS